MRQSPVAAAFSIEGGFAAAALDVHLQNRRLLAAIEAASARPRIEVGPLR